MKMLRNKLVRSKTRQNDKEERGNFTCGHSNCEICKILEPGKKLKTTVTGEVFNMNFHFDCNSILWCIYWLAEYVKYNILLQLLKSSENGLTSINPISSCAVKEGEISNKKVIPTFL